MIYQWKIPTVPVSAQTAGEEFERIYRERGKLDPADVVNESREETAPLHPCFEWNDEIAAEKYRVTQAGNIIRALVTVEEAADTSSETRAFVHVRRDYHPISVVVNDKDMMSELLESAEKDLMAFKRKYSELRQLSQVLSAIDAYQQAKGA